MKSVLILDFSAQMVFRNPLLSMATLLVLQDGAWELSRMSSFEMRSDFWHYQKKAGTWMTLLLGLARAKLRRTYERKD